MLDLWLPDKERALALAGRAIGIWANGETVTEITPEAVTWERPSETYGARGEYVDMFASAGHGLALIAVAQRRGTEREYLSVGSAYHFAKKLRLYERYAHWTEDRFWDQPIHDAVVTAIGPTIIVDYEDCAPTPLLASVADAIEEEGCHLNRDAVADIKRQHSIPTAERVDYWKVGFRRKAATETNADIPF